MTSAVSLTWDCGCSGPAFNDDFANVYIRPETRCIIHGGADVKRVYECGCFEKIVTSGDLAGVAQTCHRCRGHESARLASVVLSPTNTRTLACGCVGTEIMESFAARALYFVQPWNVCAAHKSQGANGAIMFEGCGCVVTGLSNAQPCAMHIKAETMRNTDPFTRPSARPVILRKK